MGPEDLKMCFIIQPFDEGAHDKRYKDVLKPAVADANLQAYRVDEDPAVAVIIQSIEEGIRNSEACLADISTDNPNVWFELGYALALGKGVVIICTKERKRFPFDIQHRPIIRYAPESPSDFDELRRKITTRLKALVDKQSKLQFIDAMAQVKSTQGLSPHEMAALVIIMGEMATQGGIASYLLQKQMNAAGYTPLALSLSVASLTQKGLIGSNQESDYRCEQTWLVYYVSEKGKTWLMENQDRLQLRRADSKAHSSESTEPEISDEDIPF